LEQIQDFNWVPVCTSKPEGYPDGLASWNTFHATQIFNTFIITTTVCVSEFIDIFEYRLGHMYIFGILFLLIVLEHLSQKYQLIEDNSSTEQEDVKKDRILTVNILKAIADMGIEKPKMKDLLVPINCHGDHYLKFETVDKCTYTPGKGSF
jgi:hypothetical protein